MKIKIISTTIMALLAILSSANAGLIISQYIETNSGTSPKGVELWNTTSDTIDFAVTPLTIYAARTSSGNVGAFGSSTTSNDTFTLNTGTLAANAVMVIGTTDIGDYLTALGTGVLFYLQNWYFNGDDALQVQLGGVVQDTFGQDNVVDPGSTWGTDDIVKTLNLNLALKAGVTTGDVDGWSNPTERFEVVTDSSGVAVVPNASDGLTGFGLVPTQTDSSGGDTGGGDTGGGDTGGGDTGGGDTGGGDTGGGDTGGGDTGGGDTGGGDTGGGDTGGGDTGGGDTVPTSGLIISQYVETNSGTSPKGIELWNRTGSTIDFAVTSLTVYAARTSSGNIGAFGSSTLSNDTFTLNTGTLAANAVMVIGTADMGDYLTSLGTGVQFHLQNWYFNGDDALQVQLGGVVQDTFGQDNVADPGGYWGNLLTDANGDSIAIAASTANSTIALKVGVTAGDINGWDNPDTRFETVTVLDSTGAAVAVAPNAADGLTGFGVAPTLPNASVDTDGDTYNDAVDAFPNDSTEWADSDSDGVGDNADAFPNNASESADADGDGVGDNADAFDNDPTENADSDGDGVGDNSDAYANYDDTLIGNFLTDYPQSGGGSGGLTQQDLLDARVGSVAVSVTDGTATITLQVEQSDDNMETWSTPTQGATTVDLPVTGDATFFRVRAQ